MTNVPVSVISDLPYLERTVLNLEINIPDRKPRGNLAPIL